MRNKAKADDYKSLSQNHRQIGIGDMSALGGELVVGAEAC